MKVVKKQTNSYECLVCGINNEAGLKARFYQMENETLATLLTTKNIHQSYPGRVHGGIISAIIDECIGRAIWITEPDTWGVTMDLNVKFRKKTPLNEDLLVISKITKNTRRGFEGTAYLLDINHNVLASGNARYIKLTLNEIDEKSHQTDDINVLVSDNVTDIDIDNIKLF